MLAINARFRKLHITGIERYAREVSSRLPSEVVHEIVPSYASGGLSGYVWEQSALPFRLTKNDVLWSPANVGPVAVSRQILSLHDVASLDHPEWFAKSVAQLHGILLPMLARRVLKIVTLSEFSRSRIVARLGVPETSVQVVHPGVSQGFLEVNAPERTVTRALPPRFALAYGSDDPRKNSRLIARAWASIAKTDPDLHLCLFGAPSRLFSSKLRDVYSKNVHFLGYVPDHELPEVYRRAQMLIYPSLYEGFGLPIIEAMASGIPVVASDIPVFRELFDCSALLVNPLSVAELADAVSLLARHSIARQEYIRAGVTCARKFSYDKTAAALVSLYLDFR